MAKKRIADLIREEAENLPDSDVDSTPEAMTEQLEPENPEASAAVTNAADESTTPRLSELEALVNELRAALQLAQEKEESQTQAIATLKAELQEQKTQVEKLHADLEIANQLESKLEQEKTNWKAEIEEKNTLTAQLQADLKQTHKQNDKLTKSKTDLEADLQEQKATIKKLKADLKQADKLNLQLQESQSNLELEVQEQKTIVEKLKTDLEKANQLNQALEEAQNSALKLAEANEKLTQELTALKKQDIARSESQLLVVDQSLNSQDEWSNKTLSNEEIGWFD